MCSFCGVIKPPSVERKKKVGSYMMSPLKTVDRSLNGGVMFPSDSDSPRVPVFALKLSMSPERRDPKAPLLQRHVLFSTRGVLENHPLQRSSNPSK